MMIYWMWSWKAKLRSCKLPYNSQLTLAIKIHAAAILGSVLQRRIIIATEPTPELHWSESTTTIAGCGEVIPEQHLLTLESAFIQTKSAVLPTTISQHR